MKTNKLILACGALASVITGIALTSCSTATSGDNQSITWDTGGKEASGKVDLLFVQNARNVSYANGRLVLKGVNPITVAFSDRPARMAGHMPTANTVPMWGEGKDSFLKDSPNATLSVFNGSAVTNAVVVLSDPQQTGSDLSYAVTVLDGALPANGGACSLFIDIIGCPRTPFSFAGAARRTVRRGYAYGAVPAYGVGAYGPRITVNNYYH